MSPQPPQESRPAPEGDKKPASRRRHLVWLLLLLLLLLGLFTCSFLRGGNGHGTGQGSADSLSLLKAKEDSLRRLRDDSLTRARRCDSLAQAELAARMQADSLRIDSLQRAGLGARADSLRHLRRHLRDSLETMKRRLDSLELSRTRAREDSLRRADSLARAARTRREPPFVVADPAGGVHPAPIDVAVLTLKSDVTPLCALDDSSKLAECRNLVRIDRNRILWISAVDSFGTRAPAQRLSYVIDPDASKCGPRRAFVPGGEGKGTCVDAYEFPNEPRQPPRTSVTWEEASALCAKQGKRLCLREELLQACQGPQEWKYPYGRDHRTNLCQDGGTALSRGHDHPGCRSWWGAYNLAGNAWEWTASKKETSYLVFGGFFSEGPQASCQEAKRSFYPQNRYNSVGFRCCEDAP